MFSLTYGTSPDPGLFEVGGVGPMDASAREIARFMDQVRSATGAAEVDLVGRLHTLDALATARPFVPGFRAATRGPSIDPGGRA